MNSLQKHDKEPEIELMARIASRIAPLKLYNVINDFNALKAMCFTPETLIFTRSLVQWAQFINAFSKLNTDIIPAAKQTPGKFHTRHKEIHKGAPRAVINWPSTIKRQLSQGTSSQNDFVCLKSLRRYEAPENLLLLITLQQMANQVQKYRIELNQNGLMNSDSRNLLRLFDLTYKELKNHSVFKQLYSQANSLLEKGNESIKNIEQKAKERSNANPPSAPSWSKQLLDLRHLVKWVPKISDKQIHFDEAWLLMATLEFITAVRNFADFRQVHGPSGVFRQGHQLLVPLEEIPGFLFLEEKEIIGAISFNCSISSDEILKHSLSTLWSSKQHGEHVDRWLVLHQCDHMPESIPTTRSGLELNFSKVDHRIMSLENIIQPLQRWGQW